MRFVIYDDETMEPITVVSLSGFGERDIARHGGRYRIPVPPTLALTFAVEMANEHIEMQVVDIWFEQFARRKQRSWMAFTRASDLAMLLTPDWLPGQRGAVEQLQREAKGLENFLLRAFGSM